MFAILADAVHDLLVAGHEFHCYHTGTFLAEHVGQIQHLEVGLLDLVPIIAHVHADCAAGVHRLEHHRPLLIQVVLDEFGDDGLVIVVELLDYGHIV